MATTVFNGAFVMRNMLDGRAKLDPLDNDSYPGIHWTTVDDVLSESPVT